VGVSAFGGAVLLLVIIFRLARSQSAQSEKQKKESTGAITAGENQSEAATAQLVSLSIVARIIDATPSRCYNAPA
jgi:hypothetical protein